jgi:hypothetical protein
MPRRTRTQDHSPSADHGRAIRWTAAVASSLVVALAVTTTSRAGFSASATNSASNATAGSVSLTASGSGTQIFNLTAMKPLDTTDKCVNVTYNGTLNANVHLFGTAVNQDLAPYLNLAVDVTTGPASAAAGAGYDCAGIGGTTNIFTGTLASFVTTKTTFGTGVQGWDGATASASKSYRFRLTLQDDNQAQGKSTSPAFTWEAQNT